MKSIKWAIAALIIFITACSNDAPVPVVSENEDVIEVATSISQMFSNGTTLTLGRDRTVKGVMSRSSDNVYAEDATFDIPLELKQQLLDLHIAHFPERERNLEKDCSDLENYSQDFLYKSSGADITVSLLYTCYYNYNGDYLALFWLDDDGEFKAENTIKIWEETATGTDLTSKRSKVCIHKGNDAVRIHIPAGLRFGFYFYNNNTNTYHFTRRSMNTQYNSGVDLSKCDVNSMITYTLNDYQVISMDASFPISSGYDGDVNDIVFLIEPAARVERNVSFDVPIIIPGVESGRLCEVDDFALSNNVERYPEYYNIGADPNRKISVDKNNPLGVMLQDFDNLVFNEEYNEWTYETWLWYADGYKPSEDHYLIGDAKSADWDTYSKDNYLIGVSAFEGVNSNGDQGYVKVSIHIKKKSSDGSGDNSVIVINEL